MYLRNVHRKSKKNDKNIKKKLKRKNNQKKTNENGNKMKKPKKIMENLIDLSYLYVNNRSSHYMATKITFSIDGTPCTKRNSKLIIKQNRMERKCSTICS